MSPKTAVCLMLLTLAACQTKNKPAEQPRIGETERDISVPEEVFINTDYTYPGEILNISAAKENGLEFYPIGFSPEGKFAHIRRPCNGGCGCCTHEIVVLDLFSDKLESKKSIRPEQMGDEGPSLETDWKRNYKSIQSQLAERRISQSEFKLQKGRAFTDKKGSHNYQLSIKTGEIPGSDDGMGPTLSYSLYVTMDGRKSKKISSGKFEYAVGLEYLGYLRSPFTEQIALVFSQKVRGFEDETDNDIMVVGCHLDPSYY